MPRSGFVVRGRLLQSDGSLARGAFRVAEGRILEVGGPNLEASGEVLDFGDALVAPGAIDPHVHFRDPGDPQKEDFGSGTRSAAQGGVTTVMDMPNTRPPVFTREALQDKLKRAEAKACVDFGLYAGLDTKGESTAIFGEASSVKIYLGATTGNLLVREPEVVRRALVEAARVGRTVAVHCESQDCLERHAHLADETFLSHSVSRPAVCEAEAVVNLVEAARGTGARVHIAHLSTEAGLKAIEGTGFTAEVTPHHLLFTNARLREGGAYKMNPPLRDDHDAAALWQGLADGRIACLGSDHAPHTPQEKAAAVMGECPAGVPGVETMVPLLLPHALDGRLSLARLLDASTAAARVFNLPHKGALAAGYDADFAVYDLEQRTEVRGSRLASRAGWTPFEGQPAIFPTDVFVRGEPVVLDGRFVGQAGSGRFVKPEEG